MKKIKIPLVNEKYESGELSFLSKWKDQMLPIVRSDNTLYRIFLQLLEIRWQSSVLNLADYRRDLVAEEVFLR
ncbi:hypothetical protein [Saccharibacillus brassicae]|uniref:Uncharacterized protein n=1 Tax=Saccharibacillus brassicae TaxID=2583377 RepID=A0A4Y6UTV8_SACBS|nr:hypothetical protein [Saccharibacillus brassicae]QDH19435.1 hypothetical protein FFV09_00305 [Saccharibacillus brassicae]